MTHGNLNASRTNPQWQPPKGIELIFGSNNRHIVGRALFCLDGKTEILTTEGNKKLEDLVDKPIKVISVDDSGNKTISNTCTVKPTTVASEEYQISLEDGTVIHCTPNHKLLLKNGTYKEAQYLTEDDELKDIKEEPM
jgi:DNA gyrase subunit A